MSWPPPSLRSTVFLFLLNSSGAVILFVYLLIAISQLILRRGLAPEQLKVKMWFYPWLTLLSIAGILAVLVMMFFDTSTREQLLLSLLAWAVFIGLYAITKWRGGSVDADSEDSRPQSGATHVLVLANETVGAEELLSELRAIDEEGSAEYYVCVPANPVDTGQAERKGAVWVWEATVQAAQARLDATLETLRAQGLTAQGGVGDYRPLRALATVAETFHPDRIVISTHPESRSTWLGQDVVGKVRGSYDVPVRHIISTVPPPANPPANPPAGSPPLPLPPVPVP